MSIQNTLPSYQSLAKVLNQQMVALTPAEIHGLISGILCGGSIGGGWQGLLSDLTNDGLEFSQPLILPLQQLYKTTQDLLDDGVMFQLLMPEDNEVTVYERVDALAGWVNHFLLGLGVMQPGLAQVKGEVGDAINELRNIAQLGYEKDEDQEELAQLLEEVMEYVRIAAILCHAKFTSNKPDVTEIIKPTLH